MSTPIYEELEAKWSEQYYRRAICDTYWPVIHVQTGQKWFEDDEGNEVFPETDLDEGQYTMGTEEEALASQHRREDLYAYVVPNEVKVGDTVTAIKLGEPQYAEGGLIPNRPAGVWVDLSEGYCPVSNVAIVRPKRKFKLFGRNQVTNGTL